MNNKSTHISDFVLCRKLLEIICNRADCSFIDLEIQFSGDQPHLNDDKILVIPEFDSLSKTFFSIMRLYIDNMDKICGVSLDHEIKADVTNFLFTISKTITPSNQQSKPDGFIAQRIDQYPMIWTMLRGLILPLAGVPIKKIKVVVGHSSQHDVAQYVRAKESFVFVNMDAESVAMRSAYVLYEVLKAFVDNPDALLRSLFGDQYLKQKFINFASMAFDNDEDTAVFLGILSVLCNSDSIKEHAIHIFKSSHHNSNIKTALFLPTNWWFLGLFEKMLDSVRGPDWSAYKLWKPITDELKEKIEKERKRRGLDEVPLELLLRINGDKFSNDGTQTLQSLLSKNRVWK